MDPTELKKIDQPSREDFHRAKMSIWWDFENCQIPKNFDVLSLANNICSALEQLNYYGDISIHAYGDTSLITSMQEALNSIGIRLIHVPRDACAKIMIADMMLWSCDNPSPGNYFLICGDGDFKYTLDKLRLKRYNILLAHSKNYSTSLACDVKTVWEWTSLVYGGPPYVTKPICEPPTCKPDIGDLDNEKHDFGKLHISIGRKQWKKKCMRFNCCQEIKKL